MSKTRWNYAFNSSFLDLWDNESKSYSMWVGYVKDIPFSGFVLILWNLVYNINVCKSNVFSFVIQIIQ
jgi:hypothetical protein